MSSINWIRTKSSCIPIFNHISWSTTSIIIGSIIFIIFRISCGRGSCFSISSISSLISFIFFFTGTYSIILFFNCLRLWLRYWFIILIFFLWLWFSSISFILFLVFIIFYFWLLISIIISFFYFWYFFFILIFFGIFTIRFLWLIFFFSFSTISSSYWSIF